MSPNEHIERHKILHLYFDELVADFIRYSGRLPSKTSVMELMQWSYEQTMQLQIDCEGHGKAIQEQEGGDIR